MAAGMSAPTHKVCPCLIKKKFVNFVAEQGAVSSEVLTRLDSLVETRMIAAGGFCFQVGQPATHIIFVEKGLFKLHGQDFHGTPFVVEFAAEGEFASDYAAMVEKQPCNLSCEALEDGQVSMLRFEDYQALTNSTPKLQHLARRVLEDLVVKLSKRELQMMTMNAKERYMKFAQSRGHLLARIDRNDLAAHLGITPVSLSRIRGEIQRSRRKSGKASI